jgi:DNA helicase-2/ATP-dependent DNA helicase PcrA
MKAVIDRLNPEQRRAVLATEGPLLVLAGAGSGKTRVVTTRVAHLLSRGVASERILAVTFTNKAADEMRERVQRMAGSAAQGVILSTFHSLGLELLREEAARRRRRSFFAILDQGDQVGVVREILRRLSAGRSLDAWALLERISRYKNAFLTPRDLPEPKDEYDEVAAQVYPAYLDALRAQSARDFDDLICEPVRLLERDAAARQHWQERFRYLHVDEYQDTSPAQLRLVALLAGARQNLCVVGDDDQSIYGWRGADVRNILEFTTHFPNAQVVKLEENYRSTRVILDAANGVIAKNEARLGKRLRTARSGGDLIQSVVTPTAEEEAAFLVREIKALLAEGRQPRDLAVLFRAANVSRPFEEALREAEIPFRVVGGSQFYARKEVKDALAYLRVLVEPRDELSLRRILNYPARGIGPVTVEAATRLAEERHVSFASALALLPGDSGGARVVRDFLALLAQSRKAARGLPLAQVAAELFEKVGLRQDLAEASSTGEAAQRRWGGVLDLLRSVGRFEERRSKAELPHYLQLLALRNADEDAAEPSASSDAVTLSTLHGAKGLEFPVVFLVAFEEDILPHLRTLQSRAPDAIPGDLSEERRLCYVGITRARDRLYLTRAATRSQRGSAAQRTPSRFLADIPGELLSERGLEVVEAETRASRLANVQALLKQMQGS